MLRPLSLLIFPLRPYQGLVRMAAVVFWLASLASPCFAAPPAEPAGQPTAGVFPRTVVLDDQDWLHLPRKAISSKEVDALIAAEVQASSQSTQPAPLTTDEQFLRRVSLDLTGQLPSPEQIAAFVSSAEPTKRAKLIDELLQSDAYARHWARFWRDVVSSRITNRRSMA